MTSLNDSFNAQDLIDGFRSAGGWIDTDKMGLKPFPSMGYGAVALQDLPEQTRLFSIPDKMILSGYAGGLEEVLTAEELESLGHGWARLILVMMREESKGESSSWAWYFRNLPKQFETPMFWSANDLEELKGTDIESRIGRDEAEQDYHDKIMPILRAHPDVFPPSSPHFTVEAYHLQGSRILSRSFTISHLRAVRAAGGVLGSGPGDSGARGADDEDSESEPEEWEEEDWDVPAMMPMADMLNAAYQRDNARLYDSEETMREGDAAQVNHDMITERKVKLGDQIFNTYDSPPNSELLRKYGHVDVFALESDALDRLEPGEVGDWPYGNPGDEVEISAKLVVKAANAIREQCGERALSDEDAEERGIAWVKDGQEDCFNVSGADTDPGLIFFSRILLYDAEWEKFDQRGKLPKQSIDGSVARVIEGACQLRLEAYPRTLEIELARLTNSVDTLSTNHRRAAIVRIGEMRLLRILSRQALEQGKKHPAKRQIDQGSGSHDSSKRVKPDH
ncbi:hypothetical protein BD324DRAFT_612434 [Kockovaella imperatae]|uniref:Rubisco LSMT substrate-binding domain-containing protein n=1 Tax=Kockovaella imperatae TaxID=4999 RepID=A0A1Y1US73_9TREE|nr:hypothetical protein BD324DRAFT_612434 [Kockovaella imperatae]ORX40881.1 hypothetical protein BD324DRAFT_612434 [Kockovaella imperatae]